MFDNKYRYEFILTDFDLIISDESHRSISGNTRAVIEYFYGYKLGLTATQKDYLKGVDPDKVKENDPREIEQTIVFAVSQNHARKLTKILNEFAEQLYPNKYNSDFAVQLTSQVGEAQQMTIDFTENHLNGKTTWLEGYKTCKTRICVTVGMMTTGYDCPDLLNLCMMRPVFSPADLVQIKGRGTRKHNFEFKFKNELEEEEIKQHEKEFFKLFDFFANCEYFEEKFDYDEKLKLPKPKTGNGEGGGGGVDIDKYTSFRPDPKVKHTTPTSILSFE